MTPGKQDSLIRVRPHRVNLQNVPTESAFPLVSRNHKVSATVGVTTEAATPVRAILDTGAGPNLIREEGLPEDWERNRVANAPGFNVVGAGGRLLRQKGVFKLVVQLSNLRTHARFLVVTSLAAECILGCQYIDRCVRTILPKDKRVVLSDYSVIPILRDSEQPVAPGKPVEPVPPTTKVRVSRLTTLPPRAECQVWVYCAAPGLRFLQALQKGNSLRVYMDNGVAEILPMQPFPVRLINTSDRERKLPKGMIVGHALPHPLGIVAVADQEESSSLEKDSSQAQTEAEQYAAMQHPPPLPDRPGIEGELWREDVNLTHLLPHEREKVFRFLGKHCSMWGGHL
jgi:Retroviral aspartyl protease